MDDICLVLQKLQRAAGLMKRCQRVGCSRNLDGRKTSRGFVDGFLHLRHEGVNLKAKNRTVVSISGLYDSATPFVGRSVDFLSDVLLTELRSMTVWSLSAGEDVVMDGDLHGGNGGAGADPGVGPPRYSYELFYYFGTWLFLSFTDAHAFNVKGLSGKALLIQRIRLSRKKEISRNVGSVPSIRGEQGSPHIISRGKCVNISTLFQTMKAPCNSY
jgi:hypothetical protein